MKATLGQLKTYFDTGTRAAKVRKRCAAIVAVFIILQVYFVRELIAAELLFSPGFGVLLALAGIFYILGVIGERGLDSTEVGTRMLVHSARRGYSKFEGISKASSIRVQRLPINCGLENRVANAIGSFSRRVALLLVR